MKATNKQKPVIGLSASRMRLEGSYLTGMKKSLVNSDYVEAIVKAGGLPIIIPPTCTPEEIDEYLLMCDGILITGGMDVAPILYGEMPSPRCGNFDLENDRSNLALLKAALAADKPILGICRGLQMLNVALGGTLYQDIPSQCPDCAGHSWGYIKTDAVHSVSLDTDSPLYSIFQKKELLVNSVHHQAVKDLGEGAIFARKRLTESLKVFTCRAKKFLLSSGIRKCCLRRAMKCCACSSTLSKIVVRRRIDHGRNKSI